MPSAGARLEGRESGLGKVRGAANGAPCIVFDPTKTHTAHTRTHSHVHLNKNTHTFTYSHAQTYIHTCKHTYTHERNHAYLHVHRHTPAHAYTHIHKRTTSTRTCKEPTIQCVIKKHPKSEIGEKNVTPTYVSVFRIVRCLLKITRAWSRLKK